MKSVADIIQADPNGATALGAGGGNVGANGISNIVGIGFQSWDNNHATIFTSDVYGGTQPTGNFNLELLSRTSSSNFNLEHHTRTSTSNFNLEIQPRT